MESASRRLRQIQGILSSDDRAQWTQVVVLPSGLHGAVAVQPNGCTKIAIDDRHVLDYRPLPKEVALVLSALGTPYEKSNPTPRYAVLELSSPDGAPVTFADFWCATYVLWTLFHTQEQIPIVLSPTLVNVAALTDDILLSGLGRNALDPEVHELFLLRNTFWQGAGTGVLWNNPHGWLRGTYGHKAALFPHALSFTRTQLVIAQHPLRPPKPQPGECIYKRYCVAIGKMLSVFALNIHSEEHLNIFHKWHNDPLVNKGWGEKGSLDDHRRYMKSVWDDPHVLPILMCWDDEFFGYGEVVWIRENHASTYIPSGPRDHDRGLHVLVGEERYRGPTYSQAWFRSVSHYMFLADVRTYRIIGEPKRSNPGVVKLSLDAGMHLDTGPDYEFLPSVFLLPLQAFCFDCEQPGARLRRRFSALTKRRDGQEGETEGREAKVRPWDLVVSPETLAYAISFVAWP